MGQEDPSWVTWHLNKLCYYKYLYRGPGIVLAGKGGTQIGKNANHTGASLGHTGAAWGAIVVIAQRLRCVAATGCRDGTRAWRCHPPRPTALTPPIRTPAS